MTQCQFVDSIASTPVVRFDCNDGNLTTLLLRGTKIGTPELLRAYSPSMLVDGGVTGASAYGLRTINLLIQITHTDPDNANDAIARLFRQLDQETNLLRWQGTNMSYPVFFQTLRTRAEDVDISNAGVGIWEVNVPIQAKPFALGLRQSISVSTITNDPAAATRGCLFDVTGVQGDVPTPAVMVFTGTSGNRDAGYLAVRQHGTPSDLVWFYQAESGTLGTDTTNPGGGPDAVMSGTGVNNFVRTSFATATMQTRLTLNFTGGALGTVTQGKALAGDYRLFVCVRRSDNTSVIRVRGNGTTVTVPLTTSRQLLDLGIFTVAHSKNIGYSPDLAAIGGAVALEAARDSGAGTIDWDFVALLPADEFSQAWSVEHLSYSSFDPIIDAVREEVASVSAGSPWDGTAVTQAPLARVSGGFPSLVPNQTNRFFLLLTNDGVHTKTLTTTMNIHYWPRYLHLRPAAS